MKMGGRMTISDRDDSNGFSVSVLRSASFESDVDFSSVMLPAITPGNQPETASFGEVGWIDSASLSITPTVSVRGSTVLEGTTSTDPNFMTWTITLSQASSDTVRVNYRFLSGTGQAGVDADGSDGSVVFSPGETSKTVVYRIDADSVAEPDESIILEAFSASNAVLAGGAPVLRSTGWIQDDDGTGTKLAVFVSRPLVVEGNSGTRQAVFEVSLSRPAPAPISLTYRTVDGSARAGEDYTATSGTLSFVAGQTSATVSVPVLGDTVIEPTEGFVLAIEGPANTFGQISLGEAELLDDDAGGAARPTVSVRGSTVLEGTTSTDPNFMTWTITLSQASAETVRANYRFLSGTGQARVDAYGTEEATVTFSPGETSKTVSYRVRSDGDGEPDETIVLEAFSASNAVLSGGAPVLRSTGWIQDDDGSGTKLAVSISDPLLQEPASGAANAVFVFTLSR
jgi:hypothetical protein